MNPKIEKLENEIVKTREKLVEMQERLKNLERQKTEMENSEIVALFRSLDMTPSELAAFIKEMQPEKKNKHQTKASTDKEETHNQEKNHEEI